MGQKIIRLTESDLAKIVKRVIQEEEEMMSISKKGSLTDIAKKDFSHRGTFPQEYRWMLNPDYIWEISGSRGVKVGGVSNPAEGKQFKSKDFIEITDDDGELSFAPKGSLAKIKRGDMGVMFGVNLGPKGIRVNAYWD